MLSLIAHLDKAEREQLSDDLNYLNLEELRGFCKAHDIPYKIDIETASGVRRRSRDTDRKSVVLERVRHYLKTGEVLEATCFVAKVVRLEGPPAELRPRDRLYYGWYDKKNPALIGLLEKLTDGIYRNGAIARILMREFWTAGEAPTFAQFARAWLRENEKGLGHHPEAAYLTDLARDEAGPDWKAKRVRRAKRALHVLAKIPKP